MSNSKGPFTFKVLLAQIQSIKRYQRIPQIILEPAPLNPCSEKSRKKSKLKWQDPIFPDRQGPGSLLVPSVPRVVFHQTVHCQELWCGSGSLHRALRSGSQCPSAPVPDITPLTAKSKPGNLSTHDSRTRPGPPWGSWVHPFLPKQVT